MSVSSPSTPSSSGASIARPEASPAPVGAPAAPLQLALNIANGLGLPPAEVTREIAARASDLGRCPPETIRNFLEQILLGPAVQAALQWLHDAALLAVVLPEMDATVDFGQEAGRRHKDVWEHTKQVVAQAVPRPNVRWAALLHDVGRVKTREFTPDGKVTFHGHAEVGARQFDRISSRLAFPAEQSERVRWLILHHQRANQYDGSWSDSAVRRFSRQMGEHLEELFLLSGADVTSARQHKRDQAARMLEQLRRRVAELAEADSRTPPLPSGLGNAIMSHFGLAPGRQIGELRQLLEAAVERGELLGGQESPYYLDYLERQPHLVRGCPSPTPEG